MEAESTWSSIVRLKGLFEQLDLAQVFPGLGDLRLGDAAVKDLLPEVQGQGHPIVGREARLLLEVLGRGVELGIPDPASRI